MERSPDTGAGEDHHHIEPGTPRTEAHQQLHRSAHEIAEGCAARPGSKAETTRKIPRGPAIQQRPCQCGAFFSFLYLKKIKISKIYVHFGKFQKYTPVALP